MATFLSHQGYSVITSEYDQKDIDDIKKELTVSPFVMEDFAFGNVPKYKLYEEGPTKLYVPKYYGLCKFGKPDVNRLSEGVDISVPFLGSLRQEQLEPVKAFLSACKDPEKMGGLLNLSCASGKTVMAIYLICKLAKKAMVIVHKDFLLEQWKERIAQFAPSARIGEIKAKIIDVHDKDIVIASLQSLSMKTYDKEIFKDFGTVVVDECHHTGAEVFCKALRKVTCKYSLGLSATLQRKDGLTKVFKWYLGDVVYSNVKVKKKEHVIIDCVVYYDPNPSYAKEWFMMRDKLNTAKMINQIVEYEPRNKMIVSKIHALLDKEPQRKVLVLSDRKSQLFILHDMLKGTYPCGYYLGGMDTDSLKKSEGQKILLGTYQMVSEGFDVKALDTLVLASPKSDVIQSVGRILRETPDKRKHVPTVIDIIDDFSLFQRQGKKRVTYYKSQKYELLGWKENTEKEPKKIELKGPCFQDLE